MGRNSREGEHVVDTHDKRRRVRSCAIGGESGVCTWLAGLASLSWVLEVKPFMETAFLLFYGTYFLLRGAWGWIAWLIGRKSEAQKLRDALERNTDALERNTKAVEKCMAVMENLFTDLDGPYWTLRSPKEERNVIRSRTKTTTPRD